MIETLKTYAKELLDEAESQADHIADINNLGLDIARNAMCSIGMLKPCIDDFSDYEGLCSVIKDTQILINKMRCFRFSPDLDNVSLNILISGNFINHGNRQTNRLAKNNPENSNNCG